MGEAVENENKRKFEDHAEIIRMLIRAGCPIYAVGEAKKTIMFIAIDLNNDTAIETIIQEGYDVNKVTPDVGTPLHYAVYRKNYGAVKILLENGANPNTQVRPFDSTPLYTAVDAEDYEMIDLLLQYGANPHTGSGLRNAYCKAGCLGDVRMFQLFERYGVDLFLESKCRQLADLALVHGRLEFALFYIRRINKIDWKFGNGKTLIQEATSMKDQSLVKRLINWGASIESSVDRKTITKINAAQKLLQKLSSKNLPVKFPY